MGIIVIEGGAVQDMTTGVTVIDLDNLTDQAADFAKVVTAIDDARAEGMDWVVATLEARLHTRDSVARCIHCNQWIEHDPDAPNGYIDAAGREVCDNTDEGYGRLHDVAEVTA